MAVYKENIQDIDLSTGNVYRSFLNYTIGMMDNQADRFGVRVFRNHEPVSLSGVSVQGYFRDPQGNNIAITTGNIVSNNVAEVVLPQACYNYEGQFCLSIKLIGDGVTGTMRIIDGIVSNTNAGGAVAPVETVPTYQEILAVYDQMVEATEDAQKNVDRLQEAFLSRDITFDLIALYGTREDAQNHGVSFTWDGEYCTVSGTASGSTAFCNILNIMIPISGVKVPYIGKVKIEGNYQNVIVQAFELKSGNVVETKTISASGYYAFSNATADQFVIRLAVASGNTASGSIKVSVYSMNISVFGTYETQTPPTGTNVNDIVKNGVYLLDSQNTYINPPPVSPAYLVVYNFITNIIQFAYGYNSVQGSFVRVQKVNGNWESWRPFNMTGYDLALIADNNTVDVDQVTQTGCYLLYDALTYLHSPVEGVAMLFVYNMINVTLQICIPYTPNAIYMRRKINNGDFSGWVSAAGGNTYNINNSYTFPEYSQALTVQATPSITTDTNNYLAPTGTSADRTADILSMLSTTGVCRLGPGDYYINGLQMPEKSAIYGSGAKTRVIMTNAQDGFAIKMNSMCILDGFYLMGSTGSYTPGATEGDRVGILWQGTYSSDQNAPERGMVSNLIIQNFTGSGIKCYDTGTPVSTHLLASDLYIVSCWAGINIAYSSEFHKFTNVQCEWCRFGCINNGGNNVFVNCDFSHSREVGMLMDNSQGQSTNNSHGSCVGCVFNHTQANGQSNKGTGIRILNCENGFIFDGCQIFYSKIDLQDSDGIVFSSCNFGYTNCDISISGGGAVLFMGNMFQAKPTISITSNPNTKFINCYNRDTGAEIKP